MIAPSLGISAWALVTGVAMVKGGLTVPLAALMSLTVYAGSAQLAALPLLAAGAPLTVLLATAFCVNLRFVIFSAHWRRYFGHLPLGKRLLVGYFAVDLSYALFLRRFGNTRAPEEQLAYFWGGVVWNWWSWQIPCLIGIVLADRVPAQWGLGFAGVLALLAIAYSMLSGIKSWLVAVVSASAAVAAFALPLKLNIVVAIAAAVAVGLVLDRAWPDAVERRSS
jgi:predicted branched-subunit amino acid permease